MSSDKYFIAQHMASYVKSYSDEYCFSLYIGSKDGEPCGFVNARISPKELKGICEYLLKEIEQMESKDNA